MPVVNFHKYQGTGNDFIMIDDRHESFDESRLDLIQHWCDRKFGIGADGVIFIREHSEWDFSMLFFNPDGSQSLCGNGSRCAVKFAYSLGMVPMKCTFQAVDGAHEAQIFNNTVRVKMRDVGPPVDADGDYFINTGSPHHVKMVRELSGFDVVSEGRMIRHSDRYQPGGTNVNFVEPDNGELMVRTFERGVEAETLSCGTGVTAVALVMGARDFQSPVKIRTMGGDLRVTFSRREDGGFEEIYLEGPAEKVFEGTIAY